MQNKISLMENKKGFQTLQINNETFDSTPELVFNLSIKRVGKININDFPMGINIKPYEGQDSNGYYYKKMPIIIKNIGHGMVSLEIEACRQKRGSEWIIGLETFQLLKLELISLQKSVNPGVTIFESDDLAAHLHYTIEVPADTIENLIESGAKFDKDVTVKLLNSLKKVENDIRQNLGLSLLQ